MRLQCDTMNPADCGHVAWEWLVNRPEMRRLRIAYYIAPCLFVDADERSSYRVPKEQ